MKNHGLRLALCAAALAALFACQHPDFSDLYGDDDETAAPQDTAKSHGVTIKVNDAWDK